MGLTFALVEGGITVGFNWGAAIALGATVILKSAFGRRNNDDTLNDICDNITRNLSHREKLIQTIYESRGSRNNDDHHLFIEESNSSLNYSYEPHNIENTLSNNDDSLDYISDNITQNLPHGEELTQSIDKFGGSTNNDDHHVSLEETNSPLNYSSEPHNSENTLIEEIKTKNKLNEFNNNFDLKPFNLCPYSLGISNNNFFFENKNFTNFKNR